MTIITDENIHMLVIHYCKKKEKLGLFAEKIKWAF